MYVSFAHSDIFCSEVRSTVCEMVLFRVAYIGCCPFQGSDFVFVYSLSFCVGPLVSGGVLVVLSRLAIILLTSC